MIFFTNFILPSHALANKSLEEYVSTSFSDPVGSACGRLTDTNYDADSIVFDLTNCDQASLKFYQIKQFADQAAMDTYVESSNNTIDLIVDNQYSYANYTANPVILNTFSTIFFNTQSTLLPTTLRSYLATQIADQAKKTTSLDNVITYDPFLFDAVSSSYS